MGFKELGLNRFICEQPPYHLLDRSIEQELVPMAQTYGTALIPWSPMAGGFLTGKYRRGEARPADSRYQDESRNTDLFSDAAFNVLDAVLAIAAEKGCTPSQFSLAWCTQQPGITSPIVGVRTMEQMEGQSGGNRRAGNGRRPGADRRSCSARRGNHTILQGRLWTTSISVVEFSDTFRKEFLKMTDSKHLLTDEQMQHFIVNGYINIKTDLPVDFHEAIFQETEAVFEKEGNPGNNLIPRIPDIQEIFDHPVVDAALTGLVGPNYYTHPHRHCHYNPPAVPDSDCTRTVGRDDGIRPLGDGTLLSAGYPRSAGTDRRSPAEPVLQRATG